MLCAPVTIRHRSLGRIKVPESLRAAGLRLVTLADHCGIPADEKVADEDWLKLASSQGWDVLMKDTRIRYNQRERDVVLAYSIRCFCLASLQLKAQEMADRFLSNLNSITRACQEKGPFIYAVHKTRIERLFLRSRSSSD